MLNKLTKVILLGEDIKVDPSASVQALYERDTNRLNVAKEHLKSIKRNIRSLNERVSVLEEELKVLNEDK